MQGIFILYVADQAKSKVFYEEIIGIKPTIDVPGMTEFPLSDDFSLGLMPNLGIARIVGDALPNPAVGSGIPRCELYLYHENPEEILAKALALGATEVSAVAPRNWGDFAGYCADFDGHILCFARKIPR